MSYQYDNLPDFDHGFTNSPLESPHPFNLLDQDPWSFFEMTSQQQSTPESVTSEVDDAASVVSNASNASGGTNKSSRSAAVEARIRAEAAKARLQFVKREADLKQRRAAQEAEALLLEAEKDAAVMAAEAAVLEAEEGRTKPALADVPQPISTSSPQLLIPDTKPAIAAANQSKPTLSVVEGVKEPIPVVSEIKSTSPIALSTDVLVPTIVNQKPLDPEAVPFEIQTNPSASTMLTELTNYMLKRELVTTGLLTFNDEPASYRAWKASFKRVIGDLHLSPIQEMDLIVKWLGEKSTRLIMPLRCIHVNNPVAGLKLMWDTLDKTYGPPEVIEHDLMTRLENFPKFNLKERDKLQRLGHLLLEVKCAKEEGKFPGLMCLDSAQGIHNTVQKLPHNLKEAWMKKGAKYKSEKNVAFPPFEVFVEFIQYEAKIRNDPSFMATTSSDQTLKEPKKLCAATTASSTSAPSTQIKVKSKFIKCHLCNGAHWLSQCASFKSKSVDERRQLVRAKGLCWNCLTTGHFASNCPKGSFCKLCSEKHSTFLHPTKEAATKPIRDVTNRPSSEGYKSAAVSMAAENKISRVALAVVPVKVNKIGGQTSVTTYAFLDNGSNTTFCTENLAKRVGAKGKVVNLDLQAMNGESVHTCQLISLEISSLQSNKPTLAPKIYTRPVLPISNSVIARQEDIKRWPHLMDIKIPEIEGKVELLIGNDMPELIQPLEVIRSENGGPYATRTSLGWTVNGPLGSGELSHTCNFTMANETNLDDQFRQFCNIEFSDIKTEKSMMSQNDKKALEIMNESVKHTGERYQIGMPWKSPPSDLPNNFIVAERRLQSLKTKLEKNPEMRAKYTEFMGDLLRNGHAKKIQDDRNESKWYLPHHPVIHPQKPEKVRVVFDCSAKYRGVCLNDKLLQGPDLTNSLIGVLLRFRTSTVAFSADIEKMFYQVRVQDDDANYLRYLWWPEGDLTKEPEEFQMLVHLFGGKSSPSCANFALKRVAEDFGQDYNPIVSDIVNTSFYVDDLLKSVENEDEAIEIALQVKRMLAHGGFNLTKFVSTSSKLTAALREEGNVKAVSIGGEEIQRALGVQWFVKEDNLGYSISPRDKPCTRRGILSVVSSVYDPLGLVSPFILKAKLLLQELCRLGYGWDTIIPRDKESEWQQWLMDLKNLQSLRIRRCYKSPHLSKVIRRELHHFGDASSSSYGAASYLRQVDANGRICCTLVAAKSRLAPLRRQTIPRLELQAAVVASRMDAVIKEELKDLLIGKSIFWTDSTCVLRYLNNEDTRFHTFVGNRVSTILSRTSKDQWRYVSTNENPADFASRGMPAEDLMMNDMWHSGPQFLQQDEAEWPQLHIDVSMLPNDPEVKETKSIAVAVIVESENCLKDLILSCSSWVRLKRITAWILRFRNNMMTSKKDSFNIIDKKTKVTLKISIEEIIEAERVLIGYIQKTSYPDELRSLASGKPVKSSSPLIKLDPQIMDGLLKVGGRLRRAEVSEDAKHQIVLPKNSHLTALIMRHQHQLTGHSGVNHVLAETRRKYWPVGGRTLIKSIIRKCVECRKRMTTTCHQKMADLPADRVTPDLPPFSFVGVDCFGPFNVKNGRSIVKRYGIVFTCLTIRAVHLEVSSSLDTNSFLNALRRFIARRGKPKQIRSDNGGNFVKGEKELRKAVENWNQQQIHQYLLQSHIKWIFNSPAASHHGGVWERCIRTVRKVLKALMEHQLVNDEVLQTLFCEVEIIVNGRPITKVSDDPKDSEALTPNHLLLLRSGPILPPGKFVKEDCYVSRRWRQTQYLADVFWRRWTKEYLPALQERQKWHKVQPNVAKGDVVLIRDEITPRSSWPLGRVIEVIKNEMDGLVRSVMLKTQSTTLTRPITKIVPLEVAEEQISEMSLPK